MINPWPGALVFIALALALGASYTAENWPRHCELSDEAHDPSLPH